MEDVIKLSSSNAQFTVDLYRQTVHNNGTAGNIFISPISISVALVAMTYIGARNKTHCEMKDVMHFNDFNEPLLHEVSNCYY